MADIRKDLNGALSQEAGLPAAALEIKKKVGYKPDELMESFIYKDFGDAQYNPYYGFQRRQKDVFSDVMSQLNTAVAYRDLLETRGVSKEQINKIDDAIEGYATFGSDLVQHFDRKNYSYPYGNPDLGAEYSAEEKASERKVIDLHNKYALYLKNAIQDAIIPG